MVKYSIVHILGLHNRVRASPQVDRLVNLAAHDIYRISTMYLGNRSFVCKDMSSLMTQINKKQNTVLIYPILSTINKGPLVPLYNINPCTKVSYRNLYFSVPGIGYERIESVEDIQNSLLLEQIQMQDIPEYPIAGTEIQKENLLEEYLC